MTSPSLHAPPPAPATSELLRRSTAVAHASAEGSAYLSALATGRVTRAGLAALLHRLLPVYAALEEVARLWASDPLAAPFLLPGLERTERITADLVALDAPAAPESPAAAAYAGRVRKVATTSCAAFVAHHYTRYLGDLSGGQVMRAALHRSVGIDETNGGSFFAFPELVPGHAKQRYRDQLDSTPWSSRERDELTAEALLAYRLNTELTAELDADLERWTTC